MKQQLKDNIRTHFKAKYTTTSYYISTNAKIDEKIVLEACNELTNEGLLLERNYLGNGAWDLILINKG